MDILFTIIYNYLRLFISIIYDYLRLIISIISNISWNRWLWNRWHWNDSPFLAIGVSRRLRGQQSGGWGWLPDVVCQLVGNGMVPRHVMKSGDTCKPSIGHSNFGWSLRLFRIFRLFWLFWFFRVITMSCDYFDYLLQAK